MGKILKFCTKCEEGFAEKFGFCPNCGEQLQTFEMNPVQNETAAASTLSAAGAEVETSSTASFETTQLTDTQAVPAAAAFSDNDILELDSVDVADEKETLFTTKLPADSNGNGNGNGNGYHQETAETATYNFSSVEKDSTADDDGDFRPTVLEPKDVQLRNSLLAGFGTFFLIAVLVGWVWAVMVHAISVDPLENQDLFAFVGPIEDTPVEREEPPKKNDKEGGGGGGGGKDNPIPVNKGRLPTQMENPPNQLLTVTQMSKPEFLVKNATKGNIERKMDDQPIGLPTGLNNDTLSGGPGTGGGIGGGRGNGAGGGIGGGEGNGNGNGSGNGNGNGNGDGDGDGDNVPKLTPKKETTTVAGVTTQIKILSKPQARYTDEGRKNNIQGTVTLKVTFTAAGTIGSISAVSGLPYGLTEKAIEAARQIRFEPAKRNGVPYAITKTVSYSFTIY